MSLKSWTDFSTICMSYYHSQSELCVSSTVDCQTLNFQLQLYLHYCLVELILQIQKIQFSYRNATIQILINRKSREDVHSG